MFMQVAIGAIGIGVVLMVGYLVIAQVRTALPTPDISYNNTCYGYNVSVAGNWSGCSQVSPCYSDIGNITTNQTTSITCNDVGYLSGTSNVQAVLFSGFGLLAVGVIVLAAFGLINVFR